MDARQNQMKRSDHERSFVFTNTLQGSWGLTMLWEPSLLRKHWNGAISWGGCKFKEIFVPRPRTWIHLESEVVWQCLLQNPYTSASDCVLPLRNGINESTICHAEVLLPLSALIRNLMSSKTFKLGKEKVHEVAVIYWQPGNSIQSFISDL